jgi:hypothetical protein
MAKAKLPGGAYIVNDQWVNANGEALSDEQIEELEGDDAILEAQTNPGKPLERMNKAELLEYASELGIDVDANSTKAVILDAFLETQTNP